MYDEAPPKIVNVVEVQEREDALRKLMTLPDPPELIGLRGHRMKAPRRAHEEDRREVIKMELERTYWLSRRDLSGVIRKASRILQGDSQ